MLNTFGVLCSILTENIGIFHSRFLGILSPNGQTHACAGMHGALGGPLRALWRRLAAKLIEEGGPSLVDKSRLHGGCMVVVWVVVWWY